MPSINIAIEQIVGSTDCTLTIDGRKTLVTIDQAIALDQQIKAIRAADRP